MIASLFGKPPAVSIKEFKRAGFPLSRVISYVYGAGDGDVEAAGWENAQGYLGLQYAAVGRSHPVIQELIRMHRDDGKEVPKHVGSVDYNRGVLNAAMVVEGIPLALQNHGSPLTGDKVRKGYEAIKNFDLQGFVSPLNPGSADVRIGGADVDPLVGRNIDDSPHLA